MRDDVKRLRDAAIEYEGIGPYWWSDRLYAKWFGGRDVIPALPGLNLRRAPGLRFEAEVGAMKCESAIRARGQA